MCVGSLNVLQVQFLLLLYFQSIVVIIYAFIILDQYLAYNVLS